METDSSIVTDSNSQPTELPLQVNCGGQFCDSCPHKGCRSKKHEQSQMLFDHLPAASQKFRSALLCRKSGLPRHLPLEVEDLCFWSFVMTKAKTVSSHCLGDRRTDGRTDSTQQEKNVICVRVCPDSAWQPSMLYIILLFEILSSAQIQIKFPQMKLSLSGNTKYEWGILFQRVPEGKLHQPKQKSYLSLKWQMETMNNCITLIVFGTREGRARAYNFKALQCFTVWWFLGLLSCI